MDIFFQHLNKLTDHQEQAKVVETGRQRLDQIEGIAKLDFALELIKWAERFYSRKLAKEIINDVLVLAQKTSTEKAALLIGQKAYYHFADFEISEATHYADTALKKSRDTGSDQAEAKALIVKGYLCDIRKEHRKASAWYTMALAKCTRLQQPGLLLDLGTSLSKQGEYREAWSHITQAKLIASNLAKNSKLDQIDRAKFKRIKAEAYSRLGPVYEGIGDSDAALRAYDQALDITIQNHFTNETYKIYSQKAKLYIIREDFENAEATLQKAGEVLANSKNADPRSTLYLDHDRARLFKDKKQHEKALSKYRQILFEQTNNPQTWLDRLDGFMENQADIFSEILNGIAECLKAQGRITDAETISKEEIAFSELKQQTGIYSENDRASKLRSQKTSLQAALKQIFFDEPDIVEYKTIRAEYDSEIKKVIFKTGSIEKKYSRRYFLVFKCLVDNAGKQVSGEMLDKYVIRHGEQINEFDSGLRTYIARLKREINLAQFFEPASKIEGKGWKLRKP